MIFRYKNNIYNLKFKSLLNDIVNIYASHFNFYLNILFLIVYYTFYIFKTYIKLFLSL